MKSEVRRYVLLGALGALMLTALGVVLIWLADNLFNGVVMDALDSLIAGVDGPSGAVRFSRERLATAGFVAVLVLAALLSSTGAFCAYRAHAGQRALLEQTRADAARARELAEREMQRKSDLITYLAHDLKTPLASVIAYLNLMQEAPELSAEQRAKYLGIALDKACRLDKLVGELFEIIRFNLQTIELDRERINLRLMLMQLADEFYPIVLAQRQRICVECERGLTVSGDPEKLARVFNNLLKNAAAYADPDSEIKILVSREKQMTRVSFVNRGAQIPEAKLNRVFEKFYRADEARSTRTGGAGLGLAIAKEIVEAHGGAISAQSRADCTCFIVDLPAGD